jgi:hypothetical protein
MTAIFFQEKGLIFQEESPLEGRKGHLRGAPVGAVSLWSIRSKAKSDVLRTSRARSSCSRMGAMTSSEVITCSLKRTECRTSNHGLDDVVKLLVVIVATTNLMRERPEVFVVPQRR